MAPKIDQIIDLFLNQIKHMYVCILRLGSSQEEGEASPDKRLRLDDLNLSAAAHVTEVGTTTPDEDFNKLLQQGFDLSTGNFFILVILTCCAGIWTSLTYHGLDLNYLGFNFIMIYYVLPVS